MADLRRRIVAIGPIPPPVTGFAVITERMLALLAVTHDLTIADVSPPSFKRNLGYHVGRASRVLAAASQLLAHARTIDTTYIACDGDGGLVYTAFLTALARALGYRILLHHHSFGYIDRPRALMRIISRAGGERLTHIFLCETMAAAFRNSYPGRHRFKVITNATFVPPDPREIARRETGAITIGLLSNLNRAKGLHTFLALLLAAKLQDLPVHGLLAGPLTDPDDATVLETARNYLGETLAYLGPINGGAKDQFFADIDVFVFPTTYVNEAQPTVIYEALAAGNLVISHDRGCIKAQVGGHGLTVPRNGDFNAAALAYLATLASNRHGLTTARRAAKDQYRRHYALMQIAANQLLNVGVQSHE